MSILMRERGIMRAGVSALSASRAPAWRFAGRVPRPWATRVVVATVFLSGSTASVAFAQSGGVGRLDGTVIDSARARPLAGARVVAVGAGVRADVRGSAMTDTLGRFRIDSLPPGRYVVGVESPLLDSLEIAPPAREAIVDEGGATSVELATPSGAKLRAAVCPKVTLPPGAGAIYGRVVNSDTENPLEGVTIVLSWRELGVDRNTLRPTQSTRTASVVTDAGGWYVACGVPTGAWVEMQLQRDARAGTVLRTMVDDAIGVAIRHLSFSPWESRAAADSGGARSDVTSLVERRGTAALSGRVLGPANEPVVRAEVRVRGVAGATRTDTTGWYSLGQLPAGSQILDVRRFGYEVAEVQVELRSQAATTRDVRLRRFVATLDTMRSVAARYPEFEQHRQRAIRGTFFGPEELAKMNPMFTSDIIQKVPAMRIEGRGPTAKVSARRGSGRVICPPSIVVNDVEGWSLGDVSPKDIGAIEIYPPSDPPSIYSPWLYDKGCGTILIWTKR